MFILKEFSWALNIYAHLFIILKSDVLIKSGFTYLNNYFLSGLSLIVDQ